MTVEALFDRAGELKQQLVAYSQLPRYERTIQELFAQHGRDTEAWDEDRLVLLWDYFVLEHRLRNGRTVVEQFVDARTDLLPQERQMLLGWRDVVSGPFEVQGRDGPALVLVNLVDDLTYRARSTVGPLVFRDIPLGSFLFTRLVAVGDEWSYSGPTSALPPEERDTAFQMALEMSLSTPEAAYRNPEKLAKAWKLQREERRRFIRFFGSDLVVLPGDQAQRSLDDFHVFSRHEALRDAPGAAPPVTGSESRLLELPPDLVEAETVALIYDEEYGLGFYAEYGLVEATFGDPDAAQHRRNRELVLAYLNDDSIEPMVLRRLADRDHDSASRLFRSLLNRPDFDWASDGDELLRSTKADYFAMPPQPRITPVTGQLASYASRQ